MGDMLLGMEARHTFGGLCRETLTRVWDNRKPMAAWLATNPSVAGADRRDPTDRRFEHFSRKVGAGGYVAVNVVSWRATNPADMYRAVDDGRYTQEMQIANLAAIKEAADASVWHFAAFGPVVARRYPELVDEAMVAFDFGINPCLALRMSDDGWPLHALARGKQAIPNTTVPQSWGIAR